jgi:hypothetical protein
MNIDFIRKNSNAIRIAIWVKQYTHALRVLAGIFFALALFTGLVWIAGCEVEPIAFVFGLISSLLFASPSIAEYVLPNRKPVRHMDYDEILNFIKTTNAKTDWKFIKTNWAEEAFLKEDPRLRIRVRWDDEGIHVEDFKEPWANKHTDPTANSYWYDLSNDGALIERFILVSVDGERAELPLPDRNTLEVKPLIYKVAEVFDELDTLEEYMLSSGLSVKET